MRKTRKHNPDTTVYDRATAHSHLPDKGDYDTKPSFRRSRVRKRPEVDYPNMPEYVDNDGLDKEVNRSVAQNRAANLDAVFPDPPQAALAAVQKHVGQSHSTSYQMEYKLKLMHRMLLRNMPMDTIAQTLNMSIEVARDLRKTLNKALAKEAKNFDMATHVGNSLAFFNEVRGQAMRLATDSKNSAGSRVGALGIALEAQKDTIRFMQAIGAYEANPMRYDTAEDALVEQGALLQEMAEAFLSGESGPVVLDSDGQVVERDDNELPDDVRIIEGL